MNRRRSLGSAQLHVPLAMIDVFALSLMALFVARPQFLDAARLPVLRSPDSSPHTSAGPPPVDVVVAPDGALRIDDTPCDVDQAAASLRDVAGPDRPIRLVVQLDDEGRGGVDTVIRLQLALSRADLMSRVYLATARQSLDR